MNFDCLFAPIQIGSLRVKNRFVQPAMESGTTTAEHTFSEQSVAYFAARARGGFGLQITDYMAVSPDGIGVKTEAGLWDDAFILSHRRLTNAVHAENGRIFAQLHHSGMMCVQKTTGYTVKGPSAVPSANYLEPVQAYTTEDCYAMVERFGDAARRAKRAGFDGVEVHGAHFYLIGQFMSRVANKRVDEFGGDYAGRFHFAALCIQNIKEKCGTDYPVLFRLSANEFMDDGASEADAVIYATLAQDAGADAIHVSTGSGIGGNIVTPQYFAPGFNVPAAAAVKKAVQVPVIAVGRINDPLLAWHIVQSGQADMVTLGRQSVCDPAFPNKVYTGALDEIMHCAGCMQRCYYGKGCEADDVGISCILNPFSGKENRWQIEPAEHRKKIAVVGAGVAGLECAWVLAKRGHTVDVYERENLPGGNFRLAAVPPHKTDFAHAIQTYSNLCRKYGARLHYGMEVTADVLARLDVDSIVLATGALPLLPPIPGLQEQAVVTASEVLAGKCVLGNRKVLVLGGGLVGCETADFLNQYHNRVTIVEMKDGLAEEDVKRSRVVLLGRLCEAGTEMLTGTRITKVLPDGILAEQNGHAFRLDGFDAVVAALGYRAYNPLEAQAHQVCSEVYVIGDAVKARNAKFAIYEGAKLGMQL